MSNQLSMLKQTLRCKSCEVAYQSTIGDGLCPDCFRGKPLPGAKDSPPVPKGSRGDTYAHRNWKGR